MTTWRTSTERYFEAVDEVLEGLAQYWPVTLRQVYYRLVAAQLIENTRGEYQKLSRVLSRAREQGKVPWEAIEDRGRVVLGDGHRADKGEWIEAVLRALEGGYRRNLLGDQEIRPEVWVEKDALAHVVLAACEPYGVTVHPCRGFASTSYLHEADERILDRYSSTGQRTAVLYLGDLDPSGWEMAEVMAERWARQMPEAVGVERVALTPEQVQEHSLPTDPDALKTSDSRAAKFVRRFGLLAVELDALEPGLLRELVVEAVERILDLSQFRGEQEIEIDHAGPGDDNEP